MHLPCGGKVMRNVPQQIYQASWRLFIRVTFGMPLQPFTTNCARQMIHALIFEDLLFHVAQF